MLGLFSGFIDDCLFASSFVKDMGRQYAAYSQKQARGLSEGFHRSERNSHRFPSADKSPELSRAEGTVKPRFVPLPPRHADLGLAT